MKYNLVLKIKIYLVESYQIFQTNHNIQNMLNSSHGNLLNCRFYLMKVEIHFNIVELLLSQMANQLQLNMFLFMIKLDHLLDTVLFLLKKVEVRLVLI